MAEQSTRRLSPASRLTALRRIAREPLLHFFLIGIALFLYFGRSASDDGDTKRIVVDQAQVETWTDELRLINHELKKLAPEDCRFANYTLDIKTIRSDTGIVFIAPVPICIEGHNWKEF